MDPLTTEFIRLSDKFYERFTARLEGLTDDEYLWEPAPDCWSLYADDEGKLNMRWGLIFDEVAPVTTIAWRLTHVIDLFCEERCAKYLGIEPEAENLFAHGAPPDVATARDMLDRAFARWKRYVTAADASTMFDAIGPVGGGFGSRTRMTFVLHILDEVIHHGAEIGVLRDLHRAQRAHDPALSALLDGGDVAAPEIDRLRRDQPDLVRTAAALARWDAIPRLLELGFPVGTEGRTALHHAAAEGLTDLARTLLDAGASSTATDPIYNATPLQWAEFFSRTATAEFLRSLVPR